ncbi:hypothetical protein JHN49_38555 [Streptomyces sp. MBT57]|nr:hypothetical protein [Streptomyces sp. MBT57]
MRQAGTVVCGELGHEAEVAAFDMGAQTPNATLSDCVDLSGYETYDVKAKKVIPLPTEQPLRYVMTATAQRWDGPVDGDRHRPAGRGRRDVLKRTTAAAVVLAGVLAPAAHADNGRVLPPDLREVGADRHRQPLRLGQ